MSQTSQHSSEGWRGQPGQQPPHCPLSQSFAAGLLQAQLGIQITSRRAIIDLPIGIMIARLSQVGSIRAKWRWL